MMLKRKTTDTFIRLRGKALVFAHGSAFIDNRAPVRATLSALSHVLTASGQVVPAVEISLDALGTLELSPSEVKAILDVVETIQGSRFVGRQAEQEFSVPKEVK